MLEHTAWEVVAVSLLHVLAQLQLSDQVALLGRQHQLVQSLRRQPACRVIVVGAMQPGQAGRIGIGLRLTRVALSGRQVERLAVDVEDHDGAPKKGG